MTSGQFANFWRTFLADFWLIHIRAAKALLAFSAVAHGAAVAQVAALPDTKDNDLSGWVELSTGVGLESLFQNSSALDDLQFAELIPRDDAYVALTTQVKYQKDDPSKGTFSFVTELRKATFVAGKGEEKTEAILEAALGQNLDSSDTIKLVFGGSSRFRFSEQRLVRVYAGLEARISPNTYLTVKPYLARQNRGSALEDTTGSGLDVKAILSLSPNRSLMLNNRRYNEHTLDRSSKISIRTNLISFQFRPARVVDLRVSAKQIVRQRIKAGISPLPPLQVDDRVQQRFDVSVDFLAQRDIRLRSNLGIRRFDGSNFGAARSSMQFAFSIRKSL